VRLARDRDARPHDLLRRLVQDDEDEARLLAHPAVGLQDRRRGLDLGGRQRLERMGDVDRDGHPYAPAGSNAPISA
jgi:hypothetical protein